ncbi:MAG: hypothetical protein U0835_01575 [Isosphaeraceae bacterium]
MKCMRGDLGVKRYRKAQSDPARRRRDYEERTAGFARFVWGLADRAAEGRRGEAAAGKP